MADTSYMLNISITNLQPGNPVSIALTSADATWSIASAGRADGLAIKAAGGTPLSVGALNLSTSSLSLTAGAAALNATIIIHVITGSTSIEGKTSTNDNQVIVTAATTTGITVDLVDDWTISFDG